MDTNWLRDLIAIDIHGSFSKAAISRSVSVSALSRRIQMLESWAKQTLVDRSSHPVRLTSIGQDLLSVAHAVTNEVDRAQMRLRQVGENRTPIRFLAPNSVSVALMPRLLTVLQRELGPLQVTLMHGNFREVMQRFFDGDAEFALYYACPAYLPRERFSHDVSAMIASDALLPVAKSAKNALAGSSEAYRVVLLNDDSYLGQVARSIMLHHKLDYTIRITCSQILAVRQLALEGEGMAWLPASLVEEDLNEGRLVRIALDNVPLVRTNIYVVRQQTTLNPDQTPVWVKLKEFAQSGALFDFTKRID